MHWIKAKVDSETHRKLKAYRDAHGKDNLHDTAAELLKEALNKEEHRLAGAEPKTQNDD